MPRLRTVLLALLPLLLHGLAREVDRALGLVLRADVEPESVLVEVARAMGAEGVGGLARVAAWLFGGLALWTLLGWARSKRDASSLPAALAREGQSLSPLYLRPLLSLLALAAVVLQPSYPYAFTLPVALTQDWGIGQDAAALATLVALRAPRPRWPAPRPGAVFFVAFLAYALLTPEWARWWDGHPGNEPKYLRMAVAVGHDLTLDAEGVSAAMEDLGTKPAGRALAAAAASLGRESWRMVGALVRGEAGRDAIRATRIVRQTVRGKEGGVYYVLAPGPSVVLAPCLRIDRALNRVRGVRGRLAVSLLAWNAVGALLVVALFLLVRDATGRSGLAALLAFGFALLPPFLFYFFQFYPEMPGALVLAAAFHTLVLARERLARHPWLFGMLLALLPWLHQKFLPVWLVLVATTLVVGWRQATVVPRAPSPSSPEGPARSDPLPAPPGGAVSPRDDQRRRARRWVVAFLVPQATSCYLTALYNFAITGSVRPDALFLAWGPEGVTTARVGQGLLGILLDARYGILPCVPILALAAAGLVLGGARRFAVVIPAAAAYYLTVASADNWAGAVSNLGRYFMPLAPLAVVLVGVAVARVSARRGAVTLALVLAAWSALFAFALWRDPHAANDSALLLAKSTYADGNQYIPNLFLRRWADAAPGLWPRVILWLGAIGVATFWLCRVADRSVNGPDATASRGRVGASPVAALVGIGAVVFIFAFRLERWPAWRSAPSHHDALAVGADTLAFVTGAALVREDEAVLGPGAVALLVRAPEAISSLPVTVGGEGILRVEGLPALLLRPTGARVDLPLEAYHVVRGRAGRDAVFSRTTVAVEGQAVVRPAGEPGRAGPNGAGTAANAEAGKRNRRPVGYVE